MKSLVIYSLTGEILLIAHGREDIPAGVPCMFVDIPDGAILTKIDVTDKENPKPVFEYLPDTDIGKLQKTVKELEANATVNMIAATFAAETFTDEQALKVPTLYDEWFFDNTNNKGVNYKAGKRIRFNGVLYRVLQDHTSQKSWTPEAAPSLFAKVLVEDPNVVYEWEQPNSTNGYMTGNKVRHNGVVYESLVDNNVWEPGTTGTESLWKVVTE